VKILVTGASGMLGYELIRLACRDHEVWGTYLEHRLDVPGCQMFRLDLTDAGQCRKELKHIKPEAIVHAAAMTDVDHCEREQDKARCINTEGTGLLAETAEELGARLVYISTDYVFDGEKGRYKEEDPPSPVNYYGATKLLGEDLVRRHCTQGLILRTSIYGLQKPPRQGLMERLIETLREGKSLPRFADQFATPLYAGQLSALILQLLDHRALGLLHIGSADRISRFEFARKVAEIFTFDAAVIQPVPFGGSAELARRPRDSSLVSEAMTRRYGLRLPTVSDGLKWVRDTWKSRQNERAER